MDDKIKAQKSAFSELYFHGLGNLSIWSYSPSFLTYEHPLSIEQFPWIEIMIFIGILEIGLIFLHKTINDRKKQILEIKSQEKSENLDSNKKNRNIFFQLSGVLLQFFGFLQLFYRSFKYLSTEINHLELWPDTKTIFQQYLFYGIIGFSFIILYGIIIERWFHYKIIIRNFL